MAIHYRKSKKILPGVRATVSSGGNSMSFGGSGYRKTFSKRGVTTTVGIPGTGIYSRSTKSWSTIEKERQQKSIQRMRSAEMQHLAFKESPLLMILSCCCIAFGFLSIVIPGLSAWWIVPGVILGVIFALWGMENARNKVSGSNKNVTHRVVDESQEDLQLKEFYSELETRKKNFEENNRIIETTNDFKVFRLKMDELLEHINWSYKMINEGMPASTNMSYNKAIEDFGNCYNENAYRIAKYISTDPSKEISLRKGQIEIINKYLKDTGNKQNYSLLIKSLIHKLD